MRFSFVGFAASAAALGAGAPALAADLSLRVEIPQLKVAEYHRPYVAIWIERPDQTSVGTLAVWYDADNREDNGAKWLKDLRQWWRRAGREMTVPAAGVTGPTRAPGPQTAAFSSARGPLSKLPAGQYNLVVEAAREVGGREVVKAPFQWPPKARQTVTAKGSTELGGLTVTLKP
jgi:hypothetical protein